MTVLSLACACHPNYCFVFLNVQGKKELNLASIWSVYITYLFFRIAWAPKGLVIAIKLFWLDKEWIMRLNFGWSVKLGIQYVKLELGFRYTTSVASLLGLETQRKGNLANKASLSSSDKLAFVSWSLTLRVMGLTVTGVCFFWLRNFNWLHLYSQCWGEKILIVAQGITLPAASNCSDSLGFSCFLFFSLNCKQASAYTSHKVLLLMALGHPSIAFRLTLPKLYLTKFVGFSVRSVVSCSTSARVVLCWVVSGYAFTTGVSFLSKFRRCSCL